MRLVDSWARRRWEAEGAIIRTTGEGYLLLSSGPVLLTKAVLGWGLSHTEDPLFQGFDALTGLLPAMRDVETALKDMASDGRVEALRKLTELLTFVSEPAR